MKKVINQQIVLIRAIAILIVMLGHSIILYDPSWNIYSTKVQAPYFILLKSTINVIQMPLFFSVSGFLFYYGINQRNLWQLIKNKFFRLIVPYFCITFFWMDPIKLLLKVPGYDTHSLLFLIKEQLLFQNNGHLWFLPCLFSVFILVYLLVQFVKRDIVIGAFLLTCCLFYYKFPSFFEISLVAQYSVYFFAGYLSNKYSNLLMIDNKIKLSFFFVCLISSIIISNTLFRTGAVLCMIYVLYQCNIIINKLALIMGRISKASYGLYLFHSPLIYITYTYFRDVHPLLVFGLNFLVFGYVAFFVTQLFNHNRLKWIIGG